MGSGLYQFGIRYFSSKFSHEIALVRCPCAFGLRRLAQDMGHGASPCLGMRYWSEVLVICCCSIATVACIWYIDFLPRTLFGVSCQVFFLACYITGWFFEDKMMFPVTDKQYLGWLNHQSCCLFNTFLFLLNPVQPGLDFWCKNRLKPGMICSTYFSLVLPVYHIN